MDVLLAPDVFVNASVALGSAPDQVVQRVLGQHKGETGTTKWVLDRVSAMLNAVPSFKPDAVDHQIELISGFVKLVDDPTEHGTEDWEAALVAAAKAAGAVRVITDHPDLVDKEGAEVEFISSEAWILEQQMPPPPPGT